MNFRQFKKKVYHKRKPHGFWKKFKMEERKFWAEHKIPCIKYPNRKRVRQRIVGEVSRHDGKVGV